MQHKKNYLNQGIILDGKQGGKRILFASVPADGHFNPMTGLAKHLQSLGYDVRFYSSASYANKLKKLDIPFYSFKKALEVTGSTVDDVFPARLSINNPIKKLNFDIVNFFVNRSVEYYADLLDIHKTFPFDLLIADCLFTGIPFVKDKMGIPVISLGILPLTENSKDLPPTGLGMTPSYTFAGRIKQSILRFAADKILFSRSNKVMRRILNKYQIENKNIGLFDLLVKKSSLLLQSGTPGFEYKRNDLGKNVRFIGSLLPYSAGSMSQWFDRRLNQYKNIVLVTQGTVEKNPEKIIVPTLEAFKDTDTLVIATTGGSQTQDLRTRFPQKNIIIEDFIPFGDVMPYADVYVTNGGYGGVMLGIENRLPMVVAGVHEGKNEICARVGYFSLGINLKTETPAPAQVRNAVEEILSSHAYKHNVDQLGKEFREYDTYDLCADYVKQLLYPAKINLYSALKPISKN